MRRGLTLLLTGLMLFGATISASAGNMDGKPTKILKKFAARVESHDLKGIFALLDGSYKQVQLIGTLKNDTAKFINELFSGYEISDTKTFVSVKLNEIKKCSLLKTGKFDSETKSPAYATVLYKIETYDGRKVKVSLVVVRIVTGTGILYRIAGPVG